MTNIDSTKGLILEIRAGAGGEEAAIFASDLFRMYSKFANLNNWKIRILDSNRTPIGGLKSITAEIDSADAYNKLKYESGVHRIQRIPKTEKNGRIHTSTATIAVLPCFKNIQININPSELKIDVTRSSGPGGQNVNKVETAVRLTHLPTGIVVLCQSERSQSQNKEKALEILKVKLYDLKHREQKEKITEERRQQIGGAERAEKIRTYNFPQNRVTDHRIGKNWHNLEEVMEGKLEPIIKAFAKHI